MTEVLIIGLAAYRMAFFLTQEDGPFAVFSKIRDLSRVNVDTKGIRLEIFLALQCIWCTSVWMTFLAVGLWFLEPWLVRILAAMTIPIIIDNASNRHE